MRTCTIENMIHLGHSIVEVFVGTMFTAVAFGLFILPQNFSAAGVTGFAEVFAHILPISISGIVMIINLLFMGLGFVFLGKEFTAKTVAVSILFPFMLELFSKIPAPGIQNPIINIVAAGITLGTGAGLIIRSGASSGGFGILAVILNEKRNISIAIAMNMCDAVVILIQAFGKPLSQTIYGILVITISSAVIGLIVSMKTKRLVTA